MRGAGADGGPDGRFECDPGWRVLVGGIAGIPMG